MATKADRVHAAASRRGPAAGKRRALSVIPTMADRPLNWIGNAKMRRLDFAEEFARAATWPQTPSGHPSRGAATDLSPDPLRMGRWEAPLGRVTCPYAAKPETSNLQRLLIYGVSPGMASRNSRNFRARRTGGDQVRYIGTERWPRSLFSATISADKHTPGKKWRRPSRSVNHGHPSRSTKGCRRTGRGLGLEIRW